MDDLEGMLEDDVLALLREAKDVPELPVATKTKLFADVAARVVFPGGGGGEGPEAPSAPAAPSPAASAAASTGLAVTTGKAVVALATTFAIGMATGVAVDRNLATTPVAPQASIVVVAPATTRPPSTEASGVPVTALPPATPPSAPRVSVASTAQPEVAPAVSAKGLAAERALLDVARGALARGEAQEALGATARHASEYPNGSLVEEREAIAIKALVALGRRDEARARAAEMERRFPNGLMLRAVKAAVETAP